MPQFPPGVFVFVCNFKFIETYFLSSSSLSLSSSGTLEITPCETETEPALGSLAATLECVGHSSSAAQDSLTPNSITQTAALGTEVMKPYQVHGGEMVLSIHV